MRSAAWRVDTGWTGRWEMPETLRRPVTEHERRRMVELSCGGVGPARLARELSGCGRVEELELAPPRDPGPVLRLLERSGARVVLPCDEEYPELLASIDAPPPLLYVRGHPLHELGPAVAIVGSRACTRGAARFARRLGGTLGSAGFTVVSGLARGIDGEAHEGALEAGGTTVAVLGTGIDQVYPAEHRELSQWIESSGAIVSEFPPGTGPRAWHFPARNRIISGLSMALVVVEAGLGSGALITAGFAADHGRDVYACTTGPENPAGAGVRELLRDGARLVVDADDLVAELAHEAGIQGISIDRSGADPAGLEGDRRTVWEAVTEDSTVDDLVRSTGLPVGRVAGVLVDLSLDGYVADDGGGRWRRL